MTLCCMDTVVSRSLGVSRIARLPIEARIKLRWPLSGRQALSWFPTLCDRGRMPGRTEALALHIMHTLHDATGGCPMQWRSLAGISDVVETQEAVQLAVDHGWLLIEGGHSICLTDAGRQGLDAG